MYQQYVHKHDEIPPLGSEYMQELADELWEELQYYKDSRTELEKTIWPACDRAYMCLRDLPQSEGMVWADGKSDLGETDIKDAVDFLSDSIALAMMPRDQSWLEPVAANPEDQPELNDVRDYLMALHRKADTRGQFSKHIKQLMIRGTSAIQWTWRRRTRLVRMGPTESLKIMAELSQQEGLDITLGDLKRKRVPQVTFNGPVIKPLDMHDVWLNPAADISSDEEIAHVVRSYITVDELKEAVEPDGVTPSYDNLDDIEPMSLEQIYSEDSQRWESTKNLGINPMLRSSAAGMYVPVYCFHKPVLRFKDKQFVDCYFYLAESHSSESGKSNYKIIRAVENPSDYGSRSVFFSTYQDWLNAAYGIGAVEKSIPAWNHKNVLAALTLQSMLATIFPAYIVIGGMLLDDRKLRLAPGCLNTIGLRPSVGTKFIEPVPVPPQGQQLGEQAQRWMSEKILTQMGAYGAILNDPTRSVTTSKTATQINTESSTGAVSRDNLIERETIRTLEPLCQAVLDAAKQYGDDVEKYDRLESNNAVGGTVTREAIEQADRVVVTGFHGLTNKHSEIQQLNEALVAMAQAMGAPGLSPRLIGPYQETLFKLLARLGVSNLDKYKADPLQLILENPEIQQQLMQMQQQAAREGAMAMQEEMMAGPQPGGAAPGGEKPPARPAAGQGPKQQQDVLMGAPATVPTTQGGMPVG